MIKNLSGSRIRRKLPQSEKICEKFSADIKPIDEILDMLQHHQGCGEGKAVYSLPFLFNIES